MKKQIISTVIAVSALSMAFAQGAPATTTPPVLPPAPVTGDTSVDVQIRTLNKEMEAKIKAIRDEYQTKLKVLIGNRKAFVASSTQQMRDDRKAFLASTTQQMREDRKAIVASTTEKIKEDRANLRNEMKDRREEVRGTSTEQANIGDVRGTTTDSSAPQGKAWGFLMKFFGVSTGTNTQ